VFQCRLSSIAPQYLNAKFLQLKKVEDETNDTKYLQLKKVDTETQEEYLTRMETIIASENIDIEEVLCRGWIYLSATVWVTLSGSASESRLVFDPAFVCAV
jgi:hypothetical protein